MRAVIDLWLDRISPRVRATAADVAEALDATVEDVEALLEEAHARRRALDDFERPRCRAVAASRLSMFCDSMTIFGMMCLIAWAVFVLRAF